MAIKRQRNLCVSLRRKNLESFLTLQKRASKTLQKPASLQIKTWIFIKPFLTNKEFLENKVITLIEGKKIITSDRELAKTFNEYYINIVEKSSGINQTISPSVTKIKIFIKQLSNPMKTILVYCK